MANTSPDATRQIKLRFNRDGNIVMESACHPESFKANAYAVFPQHDVIPIVFVPGVAGTNLRTGGKETWTVPDANAKGFFNIIGTSKRSTKERQELFDPRMAEVNPDGECNIDADLRWITPEEAQRRGWGALDAPHYHPFLQRLEKTLNDFVSEPGKTDLLSSRFLPEIGLMEYLAGGLKTHLTSSTDAKDSKWDYGLRAEEAMRAWGKAPPALSSGQIRKFGSYYYPVWAYGYNWLQDNEESAKGLLRFINERVLPQYANKQYFKCAGQVIVITHSMGGLVGRRAAQMDASKILGVVHGAQPVVGAPPLYRRLRAGQEAGDPSLGLDVEALITAAFMGWSEQSMTVELARAPGPLQLAPTCDYPPDWLVVRDEGEDKVIFTLPKKDPYEEIYSKTTDDVWWGMVNPAYIDPNGSIRDHGGDPAEEYREAMRLARKFHNTLGLYAHPETYGFYGIDNEKYRSFGHVEWHIKSKYGGSYHYTSKKETVTNAKATKYGSGKATLLLEWDRAHLQRLKGDKNVKPLLTEFEVVLSNERNQQGDGTVPADSGKVLERLSPTPKETFALSGFGHTDAFIDEAAFRATVYFLGRIVQKAPPPTKKRESEC